MRAYNAGIEIVQDIIDCTGNFLTFPDIIQKFGNCITWLEYYQIQLAFHPQWKRELQMSPRDNCYVLSNYELLLEKDKWSQVVYNALIWNDSDPHIEKKCDRWNRYLGTEIDYSLFLNYFANITKFTISTKLRDFQFRLLHCNIFLNDTLYRWKKVTSTKCYFCHSANETLPHFFTDCIYVQKIWDDLQRYI